MKNLIPKRHDPEATSREMEFHLSRRRKVDEVRIRTQKGEHIRTMMLDVLGKVEHIKSWR